VSHCYYQQDDAWGLTVTHLGFLASKAAMASLRRFRSRTPPISILMPAFCLARSLTFESYLRPAKRLSHSQCGFASPFDRQAKLRLR
jgi:hypothetical protein